MKFSRRLKTFLITTAGAAGLATVWRIADNSEHRPVVAQESRATEATVVRGYRITASDLETVADELRATFANQGDVRIATDSRTQQVVVVATPTVQALVAKKISSVSDNRPAVSNTLRAADSTARPVTAPQRTTSAPYQLRNVSADRLVTELKKVWGEPLADASGAATDLVNLPVPNRQNEPAFVQLDRRRNQVGFIGSLTMQASMEQMIRTLDKPQLMAGEASEILSVRRSDPAQVSKTLSMLRASLSAEPGNQLGLIGRGIENAAARTNNALAMAQQPQPAQPTPAQPAPPPANDPAKKNGPPAGEPTPAVRPGQPPDEGEDSEDGGLIGNVQIEFLDGLDVIVVRGKKKDVERVTKIINDIERLSGETKPEIEVYALAHTNSQAMSELVVQVYDQILSARQGRVSVSPLVKPNAILLIGRAENVTVVKQLIHKLDQPVAPTAQLKVFGLKFMSATEAETTVRNFFVTRPGTTGGAAGGFTPPAPQPGPAGGAGAAGATTGSSGIGGTGLATRVIVVSDFRSNSLIVQASPRDLEEVEHLLSQIDVESNAATSELRIFRLTNTLAAEMAQVLQGAIRGQTGTTPGAAGGVQNQIGGAFGQQFGQQQQQNQAGGATRPGEQRSTSLQFVTIDPLGNKVVASGIPSDVQITSDASANSLVVRAPAKTMDLIAALIKELDQVPSAESQLKVFTIINGDATNMAAMLQQLFGQQVTIGRGNGGLFGAQANAFGLNALQNQQGGANAGESTLVPLRFAVDARTNSIIASGTGGDLKVVEALILRLDEGDIPSRKMAVYRLKNSFAEDVANSITSFLQSQRQVIQQNLLFNQAIGPFEQLEREVIVVAEPQSNSVIVSATPQFYEEILRIIRELDFRPPMVMVQVLLAEVSLGDFYEFGVELGLQESLLFDRGKASLAAANPVGVPGFGFNGNGLPNLNSLNQNTVAGSGVSTFGLGRVNPTLAYGGMVLSAASDSVSVLIRALQDSGRLQVLSRPQVMAIHNRQAQVLVGEKVPRVTGSTINQQGNTQNTVQDVDVGLILSIIPQINEDGIVVMNVQAQKSALGPESQGVQIATTPQGVPIRQPRISNTSALTTISARDGQTVVFAGLITSEKQLTIRRIPYLSDIPLLGNLFQYKQDTNNRKELLIVMTPHIIQDDEDYDWLKAVESDRMNWCLGDVVNIHGDHGLRGNNCLFCPEHIPVVYPDKDPTGSAIPIHEEGFPIDSAVPGSEFPVEQSKRKPNQIMTQRNRLEGLPSAANDRLLPAPVQMAEPHPMHNEAPRPIRSASTPEPVVRPAAFESPRRELLNRLPVTE